MEASDGRNVGSLLMVVLRAVEGCASVAQIGGGIALKHPRNNLRELALNPRRPEPQMATNRAPLGGVQMGKGAQFR